MRLAHLEHDAHALRVELHGCDETFANMLRRSLTDVQKGIRGLVVMSSELDAIYQKLLLGAVPPAWLATYPSLKPLASWFKDFVGRCGFMHDWLTTGPPNSFWISAFFFPQGFFTSALQAYARRYKEPIDLLEFMPTVKPYAGHEDVPASPEDEESSSPKAAASAVADAVAQATLEALPASVAPPLSASRRPFSEFAMFPKNMTNVARGAVGLVLVASVWSV